MALAVWFGMVFEWPSLDDPEEWYRGEVTDEGEYVKFDDYGDTSEDPLFVVKTSVVGSPDEFAYIYPGAEFYLRSEPGPDGYTVEPYESK